MNRISEERIRKEMIDPQLEKAGWYSRDHSHEPPLDMFGMDEVERWFTEREVEEVVEFVDKIAI